MTLIVIALVVAALVATVLIVANNAGKVKAEEKTLEADASNAVKTAEADVEKKI